MKDLSRVGCGREVHVCMWSFGQSHTLVDRQSLEKIMCNATEADHKGFLL